MPRGHGRTRSSVENVTGQRSRSLDRTRRSLGESNYKFFSEDHQISALVLGNTEQRCIIFTLLTPNVDAYFKLAAILQSFESPDKRKHCPSAALPESPPTIIFVINPQKEHITNLSEDKCSPDTSSAWNSSGMNVMSQSCNRNKRTKPLRSSFNTSASICSTADASSGSLSESLSPLGSDDLVNDICRVEKPLKKSSKKKGKKKGKSYKRSISKKDSPELGHCEESISSDPAAEISTGGPPTCLGEQISGNFSKKLKFPRTLINKDTTVDKNDCEASNQACSSTTMQSCISYDDEMEESKAVVSLPEGFAHEEFAIISTNELKSTPNMTDSPGSVPITVYGEQGINGNYQSSSISIHVHNDEGVVVGSMVDHLQNDFSRDCSKDVATRLPNMYRTGLDSSQELVSDSKGCDPLYGVDNDVSTACDASDSQWSYGVNAECTERAQCSGQASSSNDFHPVVSGKRGRAARKFTVHTGKDSNHPVWQKVQKVENPGCISKPNNVYALSPKIEAPAMDSGAKVRSDASSGTTKKVKTGKHLYAYEISRESCKASEINVKNKHISVSKQVNHYSGKGSCNSAVSHVRPSKTHVQQKKEVKILPQENHDGNIGSSLSFTCNVDSPKQMVKSTGFDLCLPVQQKEKEHTNEVVSSGNTCRMAGSITSSVACKQISPLTSTIVSSGQSPEVDMEVHANSNEFSCHRNMHDELCVMDRTDYQHMNTPAEYFHTGSTDINFGPLLQKWVPVVRKDEAMSKTEHVDKSTVPLVDECSSMLESKNDDVEVRPNIQGLVSFTEMEVQCSSRSGNNADCSSSGTDTSSDKLMYHSPGIGVPNDLEPQLPSKLKDQQCLKFENDLGKIVRAVDDTHKLHSATGAHLISGSPLAEFERFMRSSSPVISLRHHNKICLTCHGKQEAGSSVCLHQTYNISLASLWQWYEEPGCYGLEVRAEDNHKSKRLRDGFVEFRAYFVPYLSAVQLFRQSGSSYAFSNVETTMSCEADKASRSSSNSTSVPRFSVLLPQPHREVNQCPVQSTSSSINEVSDRSSKDPDLSDEDLIFEYFEHAQPPQRRPLLEKIKELVNGDQSSNSQMYGDPSKLECCSLHDLHPASWYAVAWYPIYRIPEGNFRAAFLTYHSFRHLIHQHASSNMAGDITRIISPVVGLQSYNAKKERWFQPRDLKSMDVKNGEASILPYKLLDERLRTLEHTASVMATAAVRKGDQRSINNHPDYNHFSSRW